MTSPAGQFVRYPSIPGNLGLSSAGQWLAQRLHSAVSQLHHEMPVSLIHAHAALPCGSAARDLAQRLRLPYVVTVHGLDAYLRRQIPGLAGRWSERECQRVYREARAVICISEHVRREVLERAHELNNAVVIPNGVDEKLFAPASKAETRLMIVSIGNLIPIKGHEFLIRAMATLLPQFPGLTCRIIGEGPEKAKLEALANSLQLGSAVQFLGRKSRTDVAGELLRCSIFVLPSYYEGLGCVYLEAMACGKPAVGCFGQGIEEVIRNGENGYLVPARDVTELTNTLRTLLADPERGARLGKAARETIVNGFTLRHQAERLLAVYREVTG